jgi:hypothetical protein
MSDQVKLLDQARALRDVARQVRSTAHQLSRAADRECVHRYADAVDQHAADLEQLATAEDLTQAINSGGMAPAAFSPSGQSDD